MTTPIATAHRNLHHRIARLVEAFASNPPTVWQLATVRAATDDLEAGHYLEGEFTMSKAERPDLYQPVTYTAEVAITVEGLRIRLRELARP